MHVIIIIIIIIIIIVASIGDLSGIWSGCASRRPRPAWRLEVLSEIAAQMHRKSEILSAFVCHRALNLENYRAKKIETFRID